MSENLPYRPRVVFGILCAINLFNYIDRGIIPGSTVEFNDFIRKDISTSTPDVYLGLLQSAFIVGFVVGSVVFGHIIHKYPEFFLMGVGLSIWVIAILLSGLSYSSGSYVFLILARSLSGFGEASIQCVAPPWIERTAPEGYRAIWLSIFYTAIPVGTAIGYTYSSVISTSIGWQYAFFFEGILMAPLVASLYYISTFYPKKYKNQSNVESGMSPVFDNRAASSPSRGIGSEVIEMGTLGNNNVDAGDEKEEGSTKSGEYRPLDKEEKLPTVWEEIVIVCKDPLYLCLCLGNAAQTAALIGVATFGSAYLLGLGYYNTESQSSTVFGVVISLAGIVGTPLGGYLIDRNSTQPTTIENSSEEVGLNIETRLSSEIRTTTNETDQPQLSQPNALRMARIFNIIFWNTLIGTSLLCLSYFVMDKVGFITMITIGCTLIFLTNPGIYLGVMLVTNPRHRSMAVAVNSVLEHVLGDVPSPIISGYIKDSLAPNCVPAADATDDEVTNIAISADCRDENHQLRVWAAAIFAYMFVTALFFAIGWYLNDLRIKKLRKQESATAATRDLAEN